MDLTVALRPRTAWEASSSAPRLCAAIAVAVWTTWLLLSLPTLLLLNALCWRLVRCGWRAF
jgi:hypothetical protein